MCLFHKWSRWEVQTMVKRQALIGAVIPENMRGKTTEIKVSVQKRHCEKCGRVQVEEIHLS